MSNKNQTAKINIKVLIVIILVVVALGASLFAAREFRRTVRFKTALQEGTTAFDAQDWSAAYKSYSVYLGRNPDDVEILKKFARAGLSIRPVSAGTLNGAMSAYRRILQLSPAYEEAYEKLAMLYTSVGKYEELAYIARLKLEIDPNSLEAPLWLSDAMLSLNKYKEARASLSPFIERLETLPDKHVEYVRACVGMSRIETLDVSTGTSTKALYWLDKADDYSKEPPFAEALLNRARFYRVTSDLSEPNEQRRLALARQDLEVVETLPHEDPRIPLFLAAEWMAHNKLEKAAAELKVAKEFSNEAIAGHFFELDDWKVAVFLLEAELAIRQGTATQNVSLADDILKALQGNSRRARVLPSAVHLYIKAGRLPEARGYLKEYTDLLSVQQRSSDARVKITYLEALLAKADQKFYTVINLLKPFMVNDVSHPELLRLLAEAYSRTDQPRLAVTTLTRYLRIFPKDREMIQNLGKEYLRLRDWSSAFGTAKLAEPLDPTDIVVKLLRIEASVYLAAEQDRQTDTSQFDALFTELNRLRSDHPERVEIRIMQAMIALKIDKPEQAERELKLAIEECQEPLRAEMELARYYYYDAKRVTDALEVGQAACKRHGEVAEPWLALSDLYVAEKDYVKARDCLAEGQAKVLGAWEKRSLTIRLAVLEIVQGDRRDTGIGLLEALVAEDKQEIYVRTLLLGIREVQADQTKNEAGQTRAEELVQELKTAEGDTGLQWRLYRASLLLSSETWRSKQQDIVDLLQYCIDSDPEWSSPILLLVTMYENLGNTKKVEDLCRQALVRNPSATEVAERLVSLFEKQGRYSDAEQVLEQFQLDRQMTSAWHIRMALRAGDFNRAITELRLKVSPDDQDVNSRILLARLIYNQTKDKAQAFVYLDQAEAIDPASLTLVGARVSILNAEGRTEEAQTIIDDYVTNINTFGAYMMRAAFLASKGDLEGAAQDYEKLTTFKEYSVAGYELWSNFYAANQKYDEAVKVIHQGLAKFPTDSRLKRRLLKTLLLQGQAPGQQEALILLTELKKQFPNDPELMKLEALQMMKTATSQGIESAVEVLEEVVKLEPTAIDAHQALIDIAMRRGEYESARNYAIQALGTNPSNLTLILARGKAELELLNTQMAIELARVTLEKDPYNIDALSLLASAANKRSDRNLLKEAYELVRVTLEKDPNNIGALSLLVSVAIQSSDRNLLEKTSTLIEASVESRRDDEQLLVSRAQIQAAMNSAQVAIPELEAYCNTPDGSRSITALVTLADLYRLSGDADKARLRIDEAAKVDPNSLAVIHCRVLWLVSQKRFEELNSVSSVYISAKQPNPSILNAAAATLVASDSPQVKQEGLKLYEYLVKLLPNSVDVRLALASSLYQTGQSERAKTVYEALRKQSPNDIRVLNDLAWILQETDHQYDAALDLANRALSISPRNLNLLDTKGTILLNMPNQLAEAKAVFEELVNLSLADSPRRARALLQLSRVYVKLKELVQASQYTKQAMDIDQKMNVFTSEERAEIEKIITSGAL